MCSSIFCNVVFFFAASRGISIFGTRLTSFVGFLSGVGIEEARAVEPVGTFFIGGGAAFVFGCGEPRSIEALLEALGDADADLPRLEPFGDVDADLPLCSTTAFDFGVDFGVAFGVDFGVAAFIADLGVVAAITTFIADLGVVFGVTTAFILET